MIFASLSLRLDLRVPGIWQRVDAELTGTLRALPGVKAVKLVLARPWS